MLPIIAAGSFIKNNKGLIIGAIVAIIILGLIITLLIFRGQIKAKDIIIEQQEIEYKAKDAEVKIIKDTVYITETFRETEEYFHTTTNYTELSPSIQDKLLDIVDLYNETYSNLEGTND